MEASLLSKASHNSISLTPENIMSFFLFLSFLLGTGITMALNAEIGHLGLRALTVAPGAFRTTFLSKDLKIVGHIPDYEPLTVCVCVSSGFIQSSNIPSLPIIRKVSVGSCPATTRTNPEILSRPPKLSSTLFLEKVLLKAKLFQQLSSWDPMRCI